MIPDQGSQSNIIGTLIEAEGTVTVIGADGQERILQPGDSIREGDQIVTVSTDGNGVIRLANGQLTDLRQSRRLI